MRWLRGIKNFAFKKIDLQKGIFSILDLQKIELEIRSDILSQKGFFLWLWSMHIIDINLKFLIIIFKIVAEMLWSRRERYFWWRRPQLFGFISDSPLARARSDALIRVPLADLYHMFLPL